MTTNAKQDHPIAKLINLIIILIVVVGMIMATVDFFARGWCQKAHGISVHESSGWKVKACAKCYWDMDLENPDGW